MLEVLFEFKRGVEKLFKGDAGYCCQTAQAAGILYRWTGFGSAEAFGQLGVSSSCNESQHWLSEVNGKYRRGNSKYKLSSRSLVLRKRGYEAQERKHCSLSNGGK